jgi:hypothetical protein
LTKQCCEYFIVSLSLSLCMCVFQLRSLHTYRRIRERGLSSFSKYQLCIIVSNLLHESRIVPFWTSNYCDFIRFIHNYSKKMRLKKETQNRPLCLRLKLQSRFIVSTVVVWREKLFCWIWLWWKILFQEREECVFLFCILRSRFHFLRNMWKLYPKDHNQF